MFNKQYTPTEEEQEIFSIVEAMSLNQDTQIFYNPSNGDYILENSDKHFTVCLFSTFITLTNSNFSSRRQMESKGISALKKFAEKRLITDIDKISQEVVEKEQSLFKRMRESL